MTSTKNELAEEEVVSTIADDENDPLIDTKSLEFKQYDALDIEAKEVQEQKPKAYVPLQQNELQGILDFLSSKSELNIYQLIAFRIMRSNDCYGQQSGGKNWKRMIFDVTRYVLCIAIEIAALSMLYLCLNRTTERTYISFCYNYSAQNNYSYRYIGANGSIIVEQPPVESKVMAIGFATLLCILFFGYFETQLDNGFYIRIPFGDYHISFISSRWLIFGRVFNFIVLLNAFVLSILRVYLTINVMDIILNSMAVLFISSIDILVIKSHDYVLMLDWFKKDDNANWKKATVVPMGSLEKKIVHYITLVSNIINIGFRVVLIFVPFFFVVCY